jgi:hypothetical protein
VDTSVIRELSLRLRDFGAANWGKPDHVHGMELAWGIMDARWINSTAKGGPWSDIESAVVP